MPNVIVISGAASGIGKAFLDHYRRLPEHLIFALDISPFTIADDVTAPGTVVEYASLDLTSEHAVMRWRAEVVEYLSRMQLQGISMLIHSAGIRGLVKEITLVSDVVDDAETFEAMDVETMLTTYKVNVVGTFLLIKALRSLFLPVKSDSETTYGRIIVMGSRMGSLTKNVAGSAYAYRPSKAALNQLLKSCAIDFMQDRIAVLTLHPGRVQSKLVHIIEEGALPADEAVQAMLPLIEALDMTNTGQFLYRDGSVIPW